jgi:NADH-quinone oxidoreductase subunit A
MPNTSHSAILWPLLLYFILVVIIVAALLWFTYYVGERHHEQATTEPYESGMLPTGSAHIRFPADFYLIAMFFVIFDLETIFIVAWAVSMRQMGWTGFVSVAIFIGVIFIALAYLWREGALDWGTSQRKRMRMLTKEGHYQHEDQQQGSLSE